MYFIRFLCCAALGYAALCPLSTGQTSQHAARRTVQALENVQLLDELDLSLPGLEAAQQLKLSGDNAGALGAVAEYYRGRQTPPWPHHRILDRRWVPYEPDRFAAGERYAVGVWHDFGSGPVDWLLNATADRPDMAMSPEWTWQLNRLFHWGILAEAFEQTQDPKYVRAWTSDLRSWRDRVPVEQAGIDPASKAWRTIEVGIRLRTTPRAFYTMRDHEAVDDHDIFAYLHLVREHAEYLMVHSGPRQSIGNWKAIEASGLFLASALFPEFRRSSDWRRFATASFESIAADEFYADGAQKELTFGYGAATAGDYVFPVEIMDTLGGSSTAFDRSGYLSRIVDAYDYIAGCTGPDGYAPWFNDKELHTHWRLQQILKLMPERTDWQYIITNGKKGTHPGYTSKAFPWSGHVIMRSGWQADASMLAFDTGPLGHSHEHQDKLNVELWSHGRRILFDNGGGPYQDSAWRDWGLDTYSHNCVLVDGMAQRRDPSSTAASYSAEPVDTAWVTNDEFDYAASSYSDLWGNAPASQFRRNPGAYKEQLRPLASHRRHVLFLKPDLFIIADELQTMDSKPHDFEARWHLLATEHTSPDPSDEHSQGIVTTEAAGGQLQIIPLLRANTSWHVGVAERAGDDVSSFLGWSFLEKHAAQAHGLPVEPAMTVVHKTITPSKGHVFLTLLAPVRRAQDPHPVVSTRALSDREAEAVLRDGKRLRIVLSEKSELSVTELDEAGSTLRIIQP